MTLVVGWGGRPGPRRAEKTRSKKLSAEPVAQREQRERRLGRLAALVLLVGPGARERLHLVLDRQDTVADRQPVHRRRRSAPRPARRGCGRRASFRASRYDA